MFCHATMNEMHRWLIALMEGASVRPSKFIQLIINKV